MLETGVYCWWNRKNGKGYVGSTAVNFTHRKRCHLSDLKYHRHHNRYFQRAWDKYGKENFVFCILERCTPEKCVEREQFWLNRLKTVDKEYGYNLSPTAGNTLGFKHREETKAALSAKHTGKILTEEHKANIGRASVGRQHSIATRLKMSESAKGKTFSAVTRAKMSRAAKRRANSPEYKAWVYLQKTGTKHTEETKAKMRASHVARKKQQ